jgi:MFS family permease
MSAVRKRFIISVVSSTSLAVACASSTYTATFEQVMTEFGCSEIVAILGLSLFVVGLALSSMIVAPLSEFYGRKPVYIASLF